MRQSLTATLAFAPMVAAALLISLTPVRAAEPSPTAPVDQTAAQPQQEQAAAQDQDSALNVIIIQSQDERFIPNPYKNPMPRMISDGWAQRT